jgi:hypothetical protein
MQHAYYVSPASFDPSGGEAAHAEKRGACPTTPSALQYDLFIIAHAHTLSHLVGALEDVSIAASAVLVVVVTWQRRGLQPNRRVASLALGYALV